MLGARFGGEVGFEEGRVDGVLRGFGQQMPICLRQTDLGLYLLTDSLLRSQLLGQCSGMPASKLFPVTPLDGSPEKLS